MSQPLSVGEILTRIKCALEALAIGLNGKVSVARDPYNVFEILAAGPAGYVLILSWGGDKNISDVDVIPFLQHRIEVIMGSALGMTAQADLALIKTVGTRPALYDSVDDLRSTLLGLKFPPEVTNGQLAYAGAEPVVTPEGVSLAAVKFIFVLRAVPASPNSQTPV